MNKTPYKLRHIACNMNDFYADRHRFRFEYDGREHVASCYGKSDVTFEDGTLVGLPKKVCSDIIKLIFDKIDKEEYKWRYLKEAYEVADAYCAAEFQN